MKAPKVLKKLIKDGWTITRENGGSHKTLSKEGWDSFSFAFHKTTDIGKPMLSRISKQTGTKLRA